MYALHRPLHFTRASAILIVYVFVFITIILSINILLLLLVIYIYIYIYELFWYILYLYNLYSFIVDHRCKESGRKQLKHAMHVKYRYANGILSIN